MALESSLSEKMQYEVYRNLGRKIMVQVSGVLDQGCITFEK